MNTPYALMKKRERERERASAIAWSRTLACCRPPKLRGTHTRRQQQWCRLRCVWATAAMKQCLSSLIAVADYTHTSTVRELLPARLLRRARKSLSTEEDLSVELALGSSGSLSSEGPRGRFLFVWSTCRSFSGLGILRVSTKPATVAIGGDLLWLSLLIQLLLMLWCSSTGDAS